MKPTSPVVLIVLDGWGLAPPGPGNAITQAETPYFNQLLSAYPSGRLLASGQAVGLPAGEDGNTEVGHINLGAGQIVFQDLPRINTAIADGSFFENQELSAAAVHVKKNQSTLHLMGLVGSGGVHSNNEHLFALIKFARLNQVTKLSLHLITDGRDSPPTSAAVYVEQIKSQLKHHGFGQIASVMGRYYAMDRDHRWPRTEKAYSCLTQGKGNQAISVEAAIKAAYEAGLTDEFILPTNIVDEAEQPVSLIADNDAVIFYNFRVDRPRQLTKAFVLPKFEAEANKLAFDPFQDKYLASHLPQKVHLSPPFKRQKVINNLKFVTMTEYEAGLPVGVVLPPLSVQYPLARIIAEANLRQLHLAETEKERFVTYYFNGLREQPFPGEEWLMIPSPKVATYDLQPEMSTPALTAKLLEKITQRVYQFILVNIACPDMVAHTGDLAASIKACAAADEALRQIVSTVTAIGGTSLITADHGNAEELINLQTGEVDTEHSQNPVPLVIVGSQFTGQGSHLPPGILADVAPTILKLMGLNQPSAMAGKSLI
ncbi:MAG: 2,3-bisphosphoglycerate-independent phosphoglycerate mutase [Patescibacteria group bacterium]|nr:2,3-bisphosphoglycerate-independent phosphoglycerate mutase [Candidatus Beckwithbacteria bacterium]MDZ4228852.1 2,3-bisphosphoglycerate-independent phosphoglycerate mutase [Patescibacteria group bacterium]